MKPKIFIIEDEPDIVELYKLTFKENGMELESALSGNEGLEKLKAFAENKSAKPDLILLDLLLPDISGIDILRELRRNNEIKNIPLIVLTNYGSDQVRRLTEEFENLSFLIKIEITPQQLADIVKKKLNLKNV